MKRRMRALAAAVRSRAREDSGTVLPLMLGYTVLALVVAYVVVLSASAYLARRQLFTIADAAAIRAADAFELETVHLDATGRPVAHLNEHSAEQVAKHYLESLPDKSDDARVTAVEIEGDEVRVTVSVKWHLPLAAGLFPHGVDVTVTAASKVGFQ